MYTIAFTKEELEMIKSWGEIVADEGYDWDSADETAMKKVEEALTASGTANVAGGTLEDLNQREFDFGDEEEE